MSLEERLVNQATPLPWIHNLHNELHRHLCPWSNAPFPRHQSTNAEEGVNQLMQPTTDELINNRTRLNPSEWMNESGVCKEQRTIKNTTRNRSLGLWVWAGRRVKEVKRAGRGIIAINQKQCKNRRRACLSGIADEERKSCLTARKALDEWLIEHWKFEYFPVFFIKTSSYLILDHY